MVRSTSGFHRLDFGGRRFAMKVVAHDLATDRRVSDEDRDVQCLSIDAAPLEIRLQRQRRAAILAKENGGDPLRESARPKRIAVQSVRRVIVRVDEAGREHEPGAVDTRSLVAAGMLPTSRMVSP
jgi:hypothetical protein